MEGCDLQIIRIKDSSQRAPTWSIKCIKDSLRGTKMHQCFIKERKFSTSWITLTKSKPQTNFPLLSPYLRSVFCGLGLAIVCAYLISLCCLCLCLSPVAAWCLAVNLTIPNERLCSEFIQQQRQHDMGRSWGHITDTFSRVFQGIKQEH